MNGNNTQVNYCSADSFIQAKLSVIEVRHELEAISASRQLDEVKLDLLWSKLENIKQDILKKIRLIEAEERGISIVRLS